MENKKKTNVAKIILRVFGIIFSIVLIPALTLWIPAGGALLGASEMITQEGIQQTVSDAKLGERILDVVEEEIMGEMHSEELKTEYMQSVLNDLITAEWVDSVISEVLDAVYYGRTPKVELKHVKDTLTEKMDDLVTNGFGDVYSAWRNGTPSVYFTDSFLQSFKETLENEILIEYSLPGVSSFEKLEAKYDTVYGTGAFSKVVDEKAQAFEKEWNEELSDKVNEIIDEVMVPAEQELNEALGEIVEDKDIRTAVGYVKDFEAMASLLKIVIYGVIIGAVLLLVACFWFGTAGFVVSAIPLILGGGLCKLIYSVKNPLFDYAESVIANYEDFAEIGDVIFEMTHSILTPVFEAVAKMGNIALIGGVVLIGLAIMSGVLRKNKTVKSGMTEPAGTVDYAVEDKTE
ncbi:MAG: hypothetical protein IJZ55_03700 [Lachnospiraceae bacterium]|nr:hypothetical protein [Lachnospiraceae bacterium]